MDARTREIRSILMGQVRYQEPYYVADNGFLTKRLNGYYLGSRALRLFGIQEKCTQFRISGDNTAVKKRCAEEFPKLGRLLYLETVPVCLAVLRCPLLLPPVAVVLEILDNQVLITCYTARTMLSEWNLKKTEEQLKALLPNELRETKLTSKQQESTEKSLQTKSNKQRTHTSGKKKN